MTPKGPQMARDGKKWPGMGGNGLGWAEMADDGRKWPGMSRNCRGWTEMARNGRGWAEIAREMAKNGRKWPGTSGMAGNGREMADHISGLYASDLKRGALALRDFSWKLLLRTKFRNLFLETP